MSTVVAQALKPCACGKEVAWLEGPGGRRYAVEIRQGVVTDAAGKRTAIVDPEDRHVCAIYSGCASFLRRAFQRASAREIRITLRTPRGEPVVLTWEQPRAAVRISNGRSAPHTRRYGSLDLGSGRFHPEEEWIDELLELLASFDRDPVHVARDYGRQTGACCFCQRPLSDPRSVAAGYGPKCADKYGLPWG